MMRRYKKFCVIKSVVLLCLVGLAIILLIRILDIEFSPFYKVSYYLIDKDIFPGKNYLLNDAIISHYHSEARNASAYLREFRPQTNCSSQYRIANDSLIGVCITIVSQLRFNPDPPDLRFLTRVVARLLQLQTDTCTSNTLHASYAPLDYTLHLCANSPFAEFDEVRQRSRAQLVSVHTADEPPADALYQTDARRKEQLDYAFCLRHALRKCPPHTRYVLALEDDALPRAEFDALLRHLLFERLPRLHRDASGEELSRAPVGYVKLYHPMRLSGYFNPELANVAELVAHTLLVALVFSSTSICCAALRTRLRYSVLTAFLLVVILSRQILVPLRRAHPSLYQLVRAPSCCFPAVLFPVYAVEHAIDLLANAPADAAHAKDLLFDQFTQLTIPATDAPLLRPALSLEQLRAHRQAASRLGGADDKSSGAGAGARIRVRLRNYLLWPALVDHIGLFSGRFHKYEPPWVVL